MENYEFLSKVAEGAYGTVWKCYDKVSKRVVAVKKMKDATPVGSEEYEFALREVKLLQLLRHRNVVDLLEAFQSTSGRLYLVFEYVDHTLLHLLKAMPSGLTPPSVKSIMWQLLQSLSFMHGKKVIHRDIKPSNVLVTDTGMVKLCDFGFARPLEQSHAVADYTTYVVTRWYRSPEVLVGDAYGPAVDIWALGCICFELMTGKPLFPGRNNNDQLWLVLRGVGRLIDRHMRFLRVDPQFASFRQPLPHEYTPIESRLTGLPKDVMQFLRSCLHPDPSQRATASELLQLPYFCGIEQVLPSDMCVDSLGEGQHASVAASPEPVPQPQPSDLEVNTAQQQQQECPHGSPSHAASTAAAPEPPAILEVPVVVGFDASEAAVCELPLTGAVDGTATTNSLFSGAASSFTNDPSSPSVSSPASQSSSDTGVSAPACHMVAAEALTAEPEEAGDCMPQSDQQRAWGPEPSKETSSGAFARTGSRGSSIGEMHVITDLAALRRSVTCPEDAFYHELQAMSQPGALGLEPSGRWSALGQASSALVLKAYTQRISETNPSVGGSHTRGGGAPTALKPTGPLPRHPQQPQPSILHSQRATCSSTQRSKATGPHVLNPLPHGAVLVRSSSIGSSPASPSASGRSPCLVMPGDAENSIVARRPRRTSSECGVRPSTSIPTGAQGRLGRPGHNCQLEPLPNDGRRQSDVGMGSGGGGVTALITLAYAPPRFPQKGAGLATPQLMPVTARGLKKPSSSDGRPGVCAPGLKGEPSWRSCRQAATLSEPHSTAVVHDSAVHGGQAMVASSGTADAAVTHGLPRLSPSTSLNVAGGASMAQIAAQIPAPASRSSASRDAANPANTAHCPKHLPAIEGRGALPGISSNSSSSTQAAHSSVVNPGKHFVVRMAAMPSRAVMHHHSGSAAMQAGKPHLPTVPKTLQAEHSGTVRRRPLLAPLGP